MGNKFQKKRKYQLNGESSQVRLLSVTKKYSTAIPSENKIQLEGQDQQQPQRQQLYQLPQKHHQEQLQQSQQTQQQQNKTLEIFEEVQISPQETSNNNNTNQLLTGHKHIDEIMGICLAKNNESSSGNEELCTSSATSIGVKESITPLELPLLSKEKHSRKGFRLDSQYILDSSVHCVQEVLIHKNQQERRTKFNVYDAYDDSDIGSENLKSAGVILKPPTSINSGGELLVSPNHIEVQLISSLACHDENYYFDNFVESIYRNAFYEAIENLCRQSNGQTKGEMYGIRGISKLETTNSNCSQSNNNNINTNINNNDYNYDSSKPIDTAMNKPKCLITFSEQLSFDILSHVKMNIC